MKRIESLVLVCALLLGLAGCGGSGGGGSSPSSAGSGSSVSGSSASGSSASGSGGGSSQESSGKPETDPSGAAVSIPDDISTIITLAPSIAQTVVDLGLGDKVIAYDTNCVGLEGLPEDVPVFDIMTPDVEQLAALAPDVLLVSSLSLYDQEDPYQPLLDAGICVLCIPTSDSIEDVRGDISFLAAALDAREEGERILSEMDAALADIAAVVDTIPEEERKTAYFEISAAPDMYSCGGDVYLSELMEAAGAENVLGDQSGWLSVSGETIVSLDPDVIFTNVNYIDDPVGEILGRDGWAGLTAVKNEDVYYIDNFASSLPNENIVTAVSQMARALYPDLFPEA